MQKHKNRFKQLILRTAALYPIDPYSYITALGICDMLHRHYVYTTIGKFSTSNEGDSPRDIVDEYRKCSCILANISFMHNFYLSVKAPALQFNLEYVNDIASIALNNGHGIHFDSHYQWMADPTLQLLQDSMANCVSINKNKTRWQWGLTLPSRWKRSFGDIQWAVERGLRIRLVKGEFKAACSSEEMEPAEGFLKLIDCMTEAVPEVAIATHDHGLAKEAILRAREKGLSVQLELLFGMPACRMVALSQEMNVPLTFYVAYGNTLLLYGIRHLVTNPQKLFRPGLREVFGTASFKLAKILTSVRRI